MPRQEDNLEKSLVPPNPVAAPTLTKELSLALEKLAGQTRALVSDGFTALMAGALTVDEFTAYAADIIVDANVEAMGMSQMSWDTLMVLLGIDVEEVPHDLRDHYMDIDRLTQAIETCLDNDDQAEFRLLNVAQAEPKEAGQHRYQENVAGHSKTEGWVRELDSDPCQLCVWWWREGRVWRKNHSMPTHKGCACMPRPVFIAGRIYGVGKAAYQASEARKKFGDLDARRAIDPSAYTTHASRAKN